MTLGMINLRGLLGDNIITQLGWKRFCHENPEFDIPLTVVVPENGPYSFLGNLADMSPCVGRVIRMEQKPLQAQDEQAQRLEAISILRRSGISRLLVTESEDTNIFDLPGFYRNYFEEVFFFPDLQLKGYLNPAILPFKPSAVDLTWAERFRQEFGLETYIVIHNRQPGWGKKLKAIGSKRSDAHINDIRNFAIKPVIQACEAELPNGYKWVRLGDSSMEPIDHPRAIDTTSMGLTLGQQAALLTHARFFMGGCSGVNDLANALNTPLLTLNVTHPCGFYISPNRPSVILEKQIWRKGQQCDFTQVPLVEGGLISGRLRDGLGYETRENSREEIARGLRTMLDLLEEGRNRTIVFNGKGQAREAHELASYYLNQDFVPTENDLISPFVDYERKTIEACSARVSVSWNDWDPEKPMKVGLLGAGGLGRKMLKIWKKALAWSFVFLDSDPNKAGKSVDGIPVYLKDHISNLDLDIVFITTSVGNSQLGNWVRVMAPGIPVHYYNEPGVPLLTYWLPSYNEKEIRVLNRG